MLRSCCPVWVLQLIHTYLVGISGGGDALLGESVHIDTTTHVLPQMCRHTQSKNVTLYDTVRMATHRAYEGKIGACIPNNR